MSGQQTIPGSTLDADLARLFREASVSNAVAEREARTFAEQVRLLYRQAPLVGAAGYVVALALAGVLWPRVSHGATVVWLLLLLATLAVQMALVWRFRQQGAALLEHRGWAQRYAVAVAASGVMWGAGGLVLFVPGSLAYESWLTMALFALAAVSVQPLALFLPALYAFVPLVLLPAALRALLEGSSAAVVMCVLEVLLAAALCLYGRYQNRVILASLRARFENLDLIEELKSQKAAADEAREQAIAASRVKSHFFASASHDLRQPLHALGLFSSALRDAAPGPAQARVIANINNAIETLDDLFNKLLDISKLDAGFVEPAVLGFPVRLVFERVRSTFAPAAAEKGLELTVMDSDALVVSDPTLLERIVGNLASNAIRYTPRGGRVIVSCDEAGEDGSGGLIIEVADTGIGIPQDQHQRVFEEFYQLANPERDRRKGLGLGLAIVKRLTELLGHKLTLDSAPRRGTIFTLHVPRAEVDESARLAAEEAADAPAAGLDGRFIVVVDDERTVREGMQLLLKQWGCHVVAAGSAQEALVQMSQESRAPDLLVIDYRLRDGLTGIHAIRALHTFIGRPVPAVLITGDTDPERLQEAKASGFSLIHKPVRAARLRTAIHRLLTADAPDAQGAETPAAAAPRRRSAGG
ncbi:MAG: hybrid sensor histidine kinase/response regulator [Betaproteobacteria bacterium]|nr:hybrid sensor histidine kinase/response regulator [Betaproteobacteria bacterium]